MKNIATMLGVVAALAAGLANAAPINVVALRSVSIGDDLGGAQLGPNSPSAGLGAFNDNIAAVLGLQFPQPVSATQNSNIPVGGSQISGAGSAAIGFSVLAEDGVFAESFFQVFFDLATDHAFTLDGSVDAIVDGGRGEGRVRLSGPESVDIGVVDFGGPVVIAEGGVLPAGSYELTAFADLDPGDQQGGFMGGTADYDFVLNLRELAQRAPEPATLALLGIGLILVGGLARRGTR